jgi:hypothetical protein
MKIDKNIEQAEILPLTAGDTDAISALAETI